MFSMEITRLIERCKQRDTDALGELYKAYPQRMKSGGVAHQRRG